MSWPSVAIPLEEPTVYAFFHAVWHINEDRSATVSALLVVTASNRGCLTLGPA
jgi:hypothetical protein